MLGTTTYDRVVGEVNRAFVIAMKSDGSGAGKGEFIKEGVIPGSLRGSLRESNILSFSGGG